MSDYTFRGCHATDKPRAPTGEFVATDGTTACRDGVTRTVCECGRVAEVVTDTEVLTRVACECATAGTGCRVL